MTNFACSVRLGVGGPCLVAVLTACGGGSSGASGNQSLPAPTTGGSAAGPTGPPAATDGPATASQAAVTVEDDPSGDIPDNLAFVG